MKGILHNFSITGNFWELNQQALTVKSFKKLYDSDISKEKKMSSAIMWAIALCYDPDNSMYRRYREEDKKDVIKKEYIKDPKFNWDDYEEQINEYLNLTCTELKRDLIDIDKKLSERRKYIKETKYCAATAKSIDEALMRTKDLYDLRDELSKRINKEESGGAVKGGREESLSERGEI